MRTAESTQDLSAAGGSAMTPCVDTASTLPRRLTATCDATRTAAVSLCARRAARHSTRTHQHSTGRATLLVQVHIHDKMRADQIEGYTNGHAVSEKNHTRSGVFVDLRDNDDTHESLSEVRTGSAIPAAETGTSSSTTRRQCKRPRSPHRRCRPPVLLGSAWVTCTRTQQLSVTAALCHTATRRIAVHTCNPGVQRTRRQTSCPQDYRPIQTPAPPATNVQETLSASATVSALMTRTTTSI
jgi:hypothetical protein